jgi:hypothetical protein
VLDDPHAAIAEAPVRTESTIMIHFATDQVLSDAPHGPHEIHPQRVLLTVAKGS